MEKQTIGKFIAALRKAHGMTQKELGEKLYVSDKTVSRWERDECDPELHLIPVIAEVFGVTADELLRGQRRSESAAPNPETAARQKQKSDKQWRSLLQRRQVRFRNLSLMARGVALVGLIVAAVCDLCFTHALLGFCLGLVFLIAATIMALCFDASARLQCDEDEPERQNEVDAFNHQLTATTVSVLSLIGCVLAFLLPLLLVEAYYGMATGSWLLLGLLCVAVALGVGHVVYTLWLRPSLVRRGLLGGDGQTARDKALLKKLLKVTLPATAVGIVLIIVLEASGAAWLAKAEKFDNYADFEKFMYNRAMEEAQSEWEGFTLIPLEEGYRVMDGSDPVTGDVTFLTDTVTDKDGRVLSTYASGGVSMVTFRFDKSDDGLPVQVYTYEAMRNGWALQDGLQGVLVAAIYLLWLVCAVWYLRQRRKG
ncbi:MAG: helix-turn-helix transcriptional regulator [Oscillospiraceae bacterium]|nr:helix-turn-helix transcriptional regulator [Oscillospiraceae bacterium]